MFISIVICIYKSEQYLKKCIDSITSQCFSNYEIILVDDGSPDEDKIIDTFKADNIRIFHKENTGPADSRNFGMKQATGKYIWFVDSDDEIEPNSLEIIYNKLNNSDSDILRFNYRRVSLDSSFVNGSIPSNQYTSAELRSLKHFIVRTSYALIQTAWIHVYKREIVKDIEFMSLKDYAFEDAMFNLLAYQKAKKVETINDILYRYYERLGSLTQSNKLWLRQIINAYCYIKRKYIEYGIYDEYKDDLICAYLDDAVLAKGKPESGALAFEYKYAENIEQAHNKIKNLIESENFQELLHDSYGHPVNEELMKIYTCLYNNDEEGLYSLVCGKVLEKEKAQSDTQFYKINYQYEITNVNEDYILVPLNNDKTEPKGIITLSKDGNRMFQYINQYKEKNKILNLLYNDYPEYSKDYVKTCFEDFVVKLLSEKIISIDKS